MYWCILILIEYAYQIPLNFNPYFLGLDLLSQCTIFNLLRHLRMFIFTLMSFNSVANTYSNLYQRFLFTIALVTTFMQLSQTQLTWNNYLDIQSGTR